MEVHQATISVAEAPIGELLAGGPIEGVQYIRRSSQPMGVARYDSVKTTPKSPPTAEPGNSSQGGTLRNQRFGRPKGDS